MTLSGTMKVSAAGLSTERFRMDVISANIANAESTQVGNTLPYRRRDVSITTSENGPVITGIQEDQTDFVQRYDPGNPNADPTTGNVKATNVQPVFEMLDMMSASRAYEANIAAFNTAKGMIKSALSIGKV